MLLRLLRQLQHVVTALVLLILIPIGAEVWLRVVRPAPVPAVAGQAEATDQTWLVPSATQHHQMRPLSDVTAADGAIQFRTNSMGLRGPEPAVPAPDGLLRVLLLGDETVAGPWLEDKHTLSAQLQRHLSQQLQGEVEVLNAGVPGYSPLLSRLQYDQNLARLAPDVVVLHFDMSDVGDESIHRASLRIEGDRAVCIHPMLAAPNRRVNPLLSMVRSSALANAVSERFFEDAVGDTGSDRYAWTRAEPGSVRTQIRHSMDSVHQLLEQLQADHRTLVVATAPVSWQVVAPDQCPELCHRYGITGGMPVTDDVPFEVLTAWSRQAGVPLCNPVESFRSYESPEQFFRNDCPRLSKYGTALYALSLARTILQTPQVAARRVRSVH